MNQKSHRLKAFNITNKPWVIFEWKKIRDPELSKHLIDITANIWGCFFFQNCVAHWDQIKHKHTHHSSLWVPLPSITECRCQGGWAALVIQSSAPIVDGRVDGDCPHTWGITIAVTVIIATTISWGPDIDAAFPAAPLKQHYHHDPSEMKVCHSSCLFRWNSFGWNENWKSESLWCISMRDTLLRTLNDWITGLLCIFLNYSLTTGQSDLPCHRWWFPIWNHFF